MRGMVRVRDAALICGRSEKRIREALDSGELPHIEGERRGGTRGNPGRARWIELGALKKWHFAHGGTIWRLDMLSEKQDHGALRAELDALWEAQDELSEEVTVLRAHMDAIREYLRQAP